MAPTGRDSERWRRIEQLCQEALERSLADREPFLPPARRHNRSTAAFAGRSVMPAAFCPASR